MTTQSIERPGCVETIALGDGCIVRLTGALDDTQVEPLRAALLTPPPPHRQDVVVDAGMVTDVTDAALAVLLAAGEWVAQHGRRFLVSRTSPAIDAALAATGLADSLPRLAPLGDASDADADLSPLIPLPRPATN